MMGVGDTIAAVATPPGEGGIGIVRVSGPDSIPIVERIFHGKKPLSHGRNREMQYGFIKDGEGQPIDEVLAVVMRAPRSYTREDVVEIHCHGGMAPLGRILELVLMGGARLAEPGEFTKRAFLRGRLDLSQAEAVMDVIRAQSDRGLQLAMEQLRGALGRRVAALRQDLLGALAELEARLDFPEEDIPPEDRGATCEIINRCKMAIEELLAGFKGGRALREGVRTVILGRPNVGKSTLLNTLLGEERAIVTPIPGTTRDVIEEVVIIRGVPVRLVDTAGIRKGLDEVERLGVERARQQAARADLILLVIDGSVPLEEGDLRLMGELGGRQAIVLINKGDLPQKTFPEDVKAYLPEAPVLKVSLKDGWGLDELKKTIYDEAVGQSLEGVMVASLRHAEALEEALGAVRAAGEAAVAGLSDELICIDLRAALAALGKITGESVDGDLLDEIFSRFCLGK
ncbi:MAG: tRNA uridine-5-carboxymethylaminomethyl(34) synthesis GTPase MnmE [Firmicutes bacterium]|jgi:tRNA modification GTPase|nr:tRNA uridine-5-carboxymethylaminomethyl(34) synthesis GTPase MnmE [Bacillota bacterium]